MRITLALVAVALLAACGGSPPPTASPSNASATAPSGASDSTPTTASSRAADPSKSSGTATGDAPAKPTMDSQREPFMQGCMKKVNAPDYCECGWEQFRDVFKDADLSQSLPPGDPRLSTLQQRTIAACGGKLPEEQIQASFITSCVGGDTRKEAYCRCAWPALRKTLSPVDFIGDFQGPRFDEAKRSMAAACHGKFPADVAKADFIKDCTGGDAVRSSRCECAWTKLHARYSIEAIVSGAIDLDAVPGLKACK
jgi:hypothetical protein